MAILSKPSAAPHISLTFITTGVVMAIPSAVWYAMFHPQNFGEFASVSLFLMGLAFLLIGFSVGYIGRSARKAELPPTEAMGAVTRQDQTVADRGVFPPAAPVPVASVAYSPAAGPATAVVQTGQPANGQVP